MSPKNLKLGKGARYWMLGQGAACRVPSTGCWVGGFSCWVQGSGSRPWVIDAGYRLQVTSTAPWPTGCQVVGLCGWLMQWNQVFGQVRLPDVFGG
jgi:hypothetical protein